MEILKLPFPNSPDWEYTIALGNALYGLRVRWNGRYGRWLLDLSLPSGDPIITSIPLVSNTDLLLGYDLGDVFAGTFVVAEDLTTIEPATLLDVGGGYLLGVGGGFILQVEPERQGVEGPDRHAFHRDTRPASLLYVGPEVA